jgi:copper chaperone
MTCGHCVASVTEEIQKLSGVTSVVIDLRPDDASVLEVTAVAAAVDEAGYQLSPA